MARKSKEVDVFGIDELAVIFEKMQPRFEYKGEAFIATATRQLKKRTKQRTVMRKGIRLYKGKPRKPLRQTWREKRPKKYERGDREAIVGLVYNEASHGHLYEYGHEMVTRARSRGTDGRFESDNKRIRVSRLNALQRYGYGVKKHGRVEGKHPLKKSADEMDERVLKGAEKILDEITKDVEM